MTVKIHLGHVLDVLREMKAESIHCVITSPPYWGLRDYGTPPQVWGGDAGCEHIWGEGHTITAGRNDNAPREGRGIGQAANYTDNGHGGNRTASTGQFCSLCNAWLGNLGLEPTPSLYVQHLVEICREIRRVLRNDGTFWLNLGSSYVSQRMESDEMVLRDDLTLEQQAYVLRELAKYAKEP